MLNAVYVDTFQVGVDNTGKCKALQAKYYLNGGYSVDLSIGVSKFVSQ